MTEEAGDVHYCSRKKKEWGHVMGMKARIEYLLMMERVNIVTTGAQQTIKMNYADICENSPILCRHKLKFPEILMGKY